MTECSIPGCSRHRIARRWCRTHYERWRRHGDPAPSAPIRHRRKVFDVSYGAALQRVRTRRGPASAQPCAGCGRAAAAWHYDGEDPAERRDGRGRRFSLDVDRYRPYCRFCHRRAVVDRRAELPRGVVAPAFDVERAARLYRAGASSTGIAALLRVSPTAVITALRTHNVPIRTRGRRTDAH